MDTGSQIDRTKPRLGQSPREGKSAANFWLVATIALVATSCFYFPQQTLTQYLDPSWGGVLIYAREKGMQFGRDIVFTYGPLGFLSISCFSPDVAVMRIFFEIALGCGMACGLCLVAWRITLPWRLLLLGYFLVITTSLHWGGGAIFMDLALFSWGLLCFMESGPRLPVFTLALVVLAAVGALIKNTFLVIGLFTIGFLVCDLVLRGRRGLAAGMIIGFVLALMLGWMLLGQQYAGLGTYMANSLAVMSGYNKAMGCNGYVDVAWILAVVVIAFVAVAMRVFALLPTSGKVSGLRGALLLFWLTGLLFVEWKYGSTRSDLDHAFLMIGTVSFMPLCLEALPTSGIRRVLCSRAACLGCMVIACLCVQCQTREFVLTTCAKRYWAHLTGSLRVLARPTWYISEKSDDFLAEQKRNLLPRIRATVGDSTADVYGENQAFALFNGLNYQPRPVFQSYSVYSRPLMELNEQFYLSQHSPGYVLFNLQAIDKRFPPLEDAYVLRDLLVNYELVLQEADYLLLRRKGTIKPRLTLLKEGTVHAGEKIDLRNQQDANLWLEIDLQPTWLGRLQQFLYKPSEVNLVIQRPFGNSPTASFHAPPIMLSAGFLASPVEWNNPDALELYTSGKGFRPDSYTVEPVPSRLNVWQPEIHFRLYRIESKLGKGS